MAQGDLSATMSADTLLAKLSVLEQRGTYEERALGDVFSGWETVRQLGAGSHGRCFLMCKPDGSKVVHKRVPVSHMKPSEQEAAEREVNILATFNHPFIIRYEHAFVRQGQLNIVMEHASGGDLGGHLRAMVDAGKRPSVALSLDWASQLLIALECVHSHKVLHRDVALKNVFLSSEGVVKLGDFGVARVLASTHDMAKTKVGTPCYISPERWCAARAQRTRRCTALDWRARAQHPPSRPAQPTSLPPPRRSEGKAYSYASDVWAVGCLLYELLTTRPAFSAGTIPEVRAPCVRLACLPM